MPAQPVILNNTPLVVLYTLDLLWLLRELYGSVMIPSAVEAEFLAVDYSSRQQQLQASSWIQVVQLDEPRSALSYVGIDYGEASVLALAIERNARLVVIDERKGRRYAQRLGLPLRPFQGNKDTRHPKGTRHSLMRCLSDATGVRAQRRLPEAGSLWEPPLGAASSALDGH